jgi:dienelactone hydrolase
VADGRGGYLPVKTPQDWDVRRAHVLAHFQQVAGPLPGGERRVPLEVKVMAETREPGYVRQRLTFAAEPGDRVPAWLLVPDATAGATAKRPAVLCLHQTIAAGKDEPVGLAGNRDLAFARELALRGYVALAPDYPNFGEYKIDVYALKYESATMKAVWNNQRAVDLLAGLPDVNPDRIGVIGHSLGGHNAIFTALFEPRLKAIVSSCGFNALAHYYHGNIAGWSHAGYMPRLKSRYGLDLQRVPVDFPELIAALAPRAFFTNSPLHDDNFDVDGVRVCVEAARAVYQLLAVPERLNAEYPDAGHSFPEPVRRRAYEFLDRALADGPMR